VYLPDLKRLSASADDTAVCWARVVDEIREADKARHRINRFHIIIILL
jgi:hypothetical protein